MYFQDPIRFQICAYIHSLNDTKNSAWLKNHAIWKKKRFLAMEMLLMESTLKHFPYEKIATFQSVKTMTLLFYITNFKNR